MENNQEVRGNENNKRNFQSGNVEPNPSKPNRSDTGRSPDNRPGKESQTSFDSENSEGEINPGKLDREEIDLDRTGRDNSKGHEPYEFRAQQAQQPEENQQGGDRSLSEGSNNRGVSGGAGGAQFGAGSNAPGSSLNNQAQRNGVGGGNDSKIQQGNQNSPKEQEKLMGQTHAGNNGFGTSGTSGTNSGGKQGYGSGQGSAGSQNGSTGYNAGSQGTDPQQGSNHMQEGQRPTNTTKGTSDNSLRGSDGGVDGVKSGRGSGGKEAKP